MPSAPVRLTNAVSMAGTHSSRPIAPEITACRFLLPKISAMIAQARIAAGAMKKYMSCA